MAENNKKPKFVIFLDIDGVLLDLKFSLMESLFEHWKGREEDFLKGDFKTQKLHMGVNSFSKEALFYLDQLIEILEKDYEVDIVISSSWRNLGDTGFLEKLFSNYNFSKKIKNKVDNRLNRNEVERGPMINDFLKDNQAIYHNAKILVIDDNDRLGICETFNEDQFVICKNLFLKNEFLEALVKVGIKLDSIPEYRLNNAYGNSVSFENITAQLGTFQKSILASNHESYQKYQDLLQSSYAIEKLRRWIFFQSIEKHNPANVELKITDQNGNENFINNLYFKPGSNVTPSTSAPSETTSSISPPAPG